MQVQKAGHAAFGRRCRALTRARARFATRRQVARRRRGKAAGRPWILVPSGMTTKDDHQRAKKDGVRTVATLGAAVDALFGLTTAKRAE